MKQYSGVYSFGIGREIEFTLRALDLKDAKKKAAYKYGHAADIFLDADMRWVKDEKTDSLDIWADTTRAANRLLKENKIKLKNYDKTKLEIFKHLSDDWLSFYFSVNIKLLKQSGIHNCLLE